MVNILEYNIGVAAEDLNRYCPGGFHPIHLHDKLHDGRYEIVHKLGFGAFSTVWLARDNQYVKNLAVASSDWKLDFPRLLTEVSGRSGM